MNKRYQMRLIIGSTLFGLVVFGNELIVKGKWNWFGLLWVLYGTFSFAILFYLLFGLILRYSKKTKEKG